MKNLIPLRRKIHFWDNIVDNKQLLARTSLQAIRPLVRNRYGVYNQHIIPNLLQNIPPSTFVAPNIELLKSCYSDSIQLSILKTKIKEKQNDALKGECQYCNINEPNTIDHYLPQAHFPEFSVLSINMIPCCEKCNNAKGQRWILAGNRRIINFYYDALPDVSYLYCDIVYSKGVPKANFRLDTSLVDPNMRQVIINHFNDLNLLERYKSRSNSEIGVVRNAISPLSTILNRVDIQGQLRETAIGIKNERGRNYWRAILNEALANSNRFLTEAGF